MEAIDSLGRSQMTNHVNESGMYALILGATKAEAKRFKKWVTSEILPSIRKTGSYTVPATPAQNKAASTSLDSFRQARALEITAKVAAELCAKFPALGLPAQQGIYKHETDQFRAGLLFFLAWFNHVGDDNQSKAAEQHLLDQHCLWKCCARKND